MKLLFKNFSNFYQRSSTLSSTLNDKAYHMWGPSIPFTLLSSFAISISYADRSNLSTAIIPMSQTFNWDPLFSGVVLSSFWGGYALTQVFGGVISDRLGGERILTLALILWSICTALTPSAAELGNFSVIIVRIALGAGEGMALPAIHSMITKYVHPSYRSISASVITAACYLGAISSNLLSPYIIEKFGWESCFWIFAAAPSLLWLPSWALFLQNAKAIHNSHFSPDSAVDALPNQSQSINDNADSPLLTNTNENRRECNFSLSFPNSTTQDSIPVLSLLTYPSVWAIILAQYCGSWGSYGLLSWLPTYFSAKYGVPVSSLASFTVLPYILQLLVAVGAGFTADALISPRFSWRPLTVRNLMQLTGMIGPALCLTVCATYPGISVSDASRLISLGSAVGALTVAGVSCNQFDISPNNAGVIFGIGNTASCIAGLIAIPLSGWLYQATDSWDAVFLLFAVHYVIGAAAWAFLASDKALVYESPPSQAPTDAAHDAPCGR